MAPAAHLGWCWPITRFIDGDDLVEGADLVANFRLQLRQFLEPFRKFAPLQLHFLRNTHSQPAANDTGPDDIVYCLNEAAKMIEDFSDVEVAETIMEAIGVIQAAQILLEEKRKIEWGEAQAWEGLRMKTWAAAAGLSMLIVTPALAEPDAVENAHRVCAKVDETGRASKPCEVSERSRTVTVTGDMSSGEARSLCTHIVDLIRREGIRFPGRQWTLQIASPSSGGNSIASCNLPQ